MKLLHKGLMLMIITGCMQLYAQIPQKFRVLQENSNAILSEFYYVLPSEVTKIQAAELEKNHFQIINRYSLKALSEHQKMLTTTVDSVVSVNTEAKALNSLSTFKQQGNITSTITVFNSAIQNESLVEEMTSRGRILYLKQLVIFAVGRVPVDDAAKAYTFNTANNTYERTSTQYTKKIKTYAEYQAQSRRGTILENHTTESTDFVIQNKDDESIFFREMFYNDARLIKENLDISTNATFNESSYFPVSVKQTVSLKLPKELQRSLLDNYTLLRKSNINTESLHFPRIFRFESKLKSGIYKDLRSLLEESIQISINKMQYEDVTKKWSLNIPNVYINIFVGDIDVGYLLLYSGDKVMDEIDIEIQYHTKDTAKANYKIRYEIVY